ncbi:MAG: glycerol-3-phosphate 1-O-acyltransferase PlsY [Clostridia bacterium]|jgi:glycerol-3-phosphate acyltransferase PlsY|nr:glycerol-3-phosphate 1-O-acyltransferase PlsY [Clostridiaceae bacterium]
MVIPYIIAALVGYLLGGINSAIIVGKLSGVDVREHGSKNAGLTNAVRVLGKKKALFVLLGDVLKGVLACVFGIVLAPDTPSVMLLAGLMCVIGHNWPVYFGFKGGKGALTSVTVLFFADYRIALILIGVFILLVALTRYVSLGSMTGAVLLPVFGIVFRKGLDFFIFSMILAVMLVWRHRGNIQRLIKGEESKLDLKKK